jgi:hypothetical protein
MPSSLRDDLMSSASSHEDEILISQFHWDGNNQNELVFFFKPECFLLADSDRTAMLVDMTLEHFKAFDASIAGALMLSGRRLGELAIMDRHYGYINRLSRTASRMLDASDFARIQEALEIPDLSRYAVLGGHEFLNRWSEFDPVSLNSLWFTKKSIKLRSGFYIQTYQVENTPIVLVNGFHPMQLLHFTGPSRRIILLLVHSDSDWRMLKDDLVGDTYPERAKPGSIRSEIYANRSRYGAADVSVANNFVHLSAGPFEALFEMWNFLDPLSHLHFRLRDTTLGKLMLARGFVEGDIERTIRNPGIEVNGKALDLFTLTENKNTAEALTYYNEQFGLVPA